MSRPTNVIVVGAGIIGCAVAHELAYRGASVRIVDERPVGQGATQASAGILAPYIEAETDPDLLGLTVRSLQLYDRFVSRVVADSGLTVVPDSGTDELAGITGRFTLNIVDGKHFYEFEYSLPQ